MMYDDDKTWKQHYDDWLLIIENMKWTDDDTKPEQFDYRKKVIRNLISDYEKSHNTI